MTPFTPRLKRALLYAISLADSRSEREVEAPHLLYGILRLGEGVAPTVLRAHALTETDFTAFTLAPAALTEAPHPYRPCAMAALSSAMLAATQMNHQLVGIEHLLLGILENPSPEVLSLLKQKKTDADRIASEVKREL